MGVPGKRFFKPSFKREIVDGVLNNKLTYEEIEKKWDLSRAQVQRWIRQIAPHGHLKQRASRSHVNAPVASVPLTYPHSASTADNSRDDRDKTIWELRMIIAKLTVKVERLTAELNNKRRYEDQVLYGDDLAIDPERPR